MLRFGVWVQFVAAFSISIVSLPVWANDAKPAVAQPDSTPLVFANTWGYTLALNGTGFYNEIAADVLAHIPGAENYKVSGSAKYRVMPFRRAQMMFFYRTDSCLYPSSMAALVADNLIKDPAAYVESTGLFAARVHLFVRAGETPPSKLEDIRGKSIAYPHGSVVGKLLDGHGARLISVNDEIDRAEMLLGGRVDIMSGVLPDTALIFEKIKSKMPSYDPSLVVIKAPVTFVCHKNAVTESFINNINASIQILSSDTQYQDRLAKAKVAEALLNSVGDVDVAADDLNALAPAVSGREKGDKNKGKNRSGRKFPKHGRP